MRVNFTHDNKSYTICTISEFANLLTEYLMDPKPKFSTPATFVADFAMLDTYDDLAIDIDYIDEVFLRTNSWFGVKELGEVGFNNDEYSVFIFDYYGGGHFRSVQADMFYEAEDIESDVLGVLCDIFDLRPDDTEWLVLVQWTEDKSIVDDRQQEIDEETKHIEDEAVKNFAEILTDYAQGVQASGYDGIGVEDIKDKLYEYLNWDIKYTPEYEAGKNNK